MTAEQSQHQPSDQEVAVGVLMPGFAGTVVPEWLKEPLAQGLGAVCLFAVNTPDPVTTRALTEELRAHGPQVLVTVDEEGGDVTRLERVAGSSVPGNEALGTVDDVELSHRVGEAIGELCRLAGIDLTLAPDVDVASNRLNPVIGTRSFGADPALVTRHARAVLAGLHAAGTGGCTKHFPGHGDTAVDSHHAVPVVDVDPQLLADRDLAPFRATADLTDAVMAGHIVVPALGPDPATVSAWTYGLIREQGFTGMTCTDAISMEAVRAGDADHPAGIGEATVRALEAGVDLVCLGSPKETSEADWAEALAAVLAALRSGRLDRDALLASAARVRATRRRANDRRPVAEPALAEVRRRIEQLGLEVALRAQRITGDVRTKDPVAFVDLRGGATIASGSLGQVVPDELDAARRHLGLAPVVRIDAADLAAHPDHSVVVLTRESLRPGAERDELTTLLVARPDAIVLHAGMDRSAPDDLIGSGRMIATHGVGRANARAAAQALLDAEIQW